MRIFAPELKYAHFHHYWNLVTPLMSHRRHHSRDAHLILKIINGIQIGAVCWHLNLTLIRFSTDEALIELNQVNIRFNNSLNWTKNITQNDYLMTLQRFAPVWHCMFKYLLYAAQMTDWSTKIIDSDMTSMVYVINLIKCNKHELRHAAENARCSGGK